MNRLIVISEKEELKLIDKLNFSLLKNVPVLITGVGALNVINALKDLPKDIEIINVGYAGSKNLKINKFYEVGAVKLFHPNVEYDENKYFCNLGYNEISNRCKIDGEILDIKSCYTSSDFVLNSDIEDCLFDMELAYIMSLGFKKVTSYKYVSDNLDLLEYRIASNEQ